MSSTCNLVDFCLIQVYTIVAMPHRQRKLCGAECCFRLPSWGGFPLPFGKFLNIWGSLDVIWCNILDKFQGKLLQICNISYRGNKYGVFILGLKGWGSIVPAHHTFGRGFSLPSPHFPLPMPCHHSLHL